MVIYLFIFILADSGMNSIQDDMADMNLDGKVSLQNYYFQKQG